MANKMETYKSKAFKTRIEINLAEHATSVHDNFQLIGASYNIHGFTCELCHHPECLKEYHIKNSETNEIMKVGSECVKHFIGENDINIVEGLQKQLKKIVNKMRRSIKKALGDNYKDIDKNKKREIICKAYMTYQTKEVIAGIKKKNILTREDVYRIIEEVGLNLDETLKGK